MTRRQRPAPATSADQVAVVYIRVSTREQARDGISLDAQEAICRRTAEARGRVVVGVYRDEGVSGRSELANRTGLRHAIAEVHALADAGKDAVLVAYSVSRVARSQRILWQLIDPAKELALPLLSATEPFDTSTSMGRAMLGMIGVWSQLEADIIGERTRDALAQVRASGKRLGAPTTLMKSESTVALIVKLRDDGLSIRAICEKLNADGVRGIRGGKWWVKNVRSVLAQAAAAPKKAKVERGPGPTP